MTFIADRDLLNDFLNQPSDSTAPSENFIGVPDEVDVPDYVLYEMLSEGMRMWDGESGGVWERWLNEQSQLQSIVERIWQKIWRTRRLVKWQETPDAALDYLRWHVGFGDGQGAATDFAKRLTPDQLRLLISFAAPLWARRGRLDLLASAVASFTTGVYPRITAANFDMPEVDEVVIGGDGDANCDLLLGKTEIYDDSVSYSDIYTTHVRIYDDGSVDKELVADLCELMRPSHERYELAFVDFVDTFTRGRYGHWESRGSVAGTVELGDRSYDPPLLPGMVLSTGAIEKIVTPESDTWDNLFFTGYIDTRLESGFLTTIRFFEQDDNNYYYIAISPAIVTFGRRLAGSNGVISSFPTAVDGRHRFALDVQPLGANTHVRLYWDDELVVDDATTSFFSDGTISLWCNVGTAVRYSWLENYSRPMTVTKLTP